MRLESEFMWKPRRTAGWWSRYTDGNTYSFTEGVDFPVGDLEKVRMSALNYTARINVGIPLNSPALTKMRTSVKTVDGVRVLYLQTYWPTPA